MIPSVAPSVSLAQTKRFTFIVEDSSSDVSRPLSSSPLLLDSAVFDLSEGQLRVDLPVLLSSVDPRLLHVVAEPTPPSVRQGHTLSLDLRSSINRLRGIIFPSALDCRPLVEEACLVGRSPLLDLVYDFSKEVGMELHVLENTLGAIHDDLQPGSHSHERTAFGRVRVWLADKAEVECAKKILVNCNCTSLDIGIKQSVPLPPLCAGIAAVHL